MNVVVLRFPESAQKEEVVLPFDSVPPIRSVVIHEDVRWRVLGIEYALGWRNHCSKEYVPTLILAEASSMY